MSNRKSAVVVGGIVAVAAAMIVTVGLDPTAGAQETFLTAWRKRGSYARKAPFEHWLVRVCLRCCYARLKKDKRGGDERFTVVLALEHGEAVGVGAQAAAEQLVAVPQQVVGGDGRGDVRPGAASACQVDVRAAEDVAGAILAASAGCDYLFVGCQGKSALERLRLGSIATAVMRKSATPVVCCPLPS